MISDQFASRRCPSKPFETQRVAHGQLHDHTLMISAAPMLPSLGQPGLYPRSTGLYPRSPLHRWCPLSRILRKPAGDARAAASPPASRPAAWAPEDTTTRPFSRHFTATRGDGTPAKGAAPASSIVTLGLKGARRVAGGSVSRRARCGQAIVRDSGSERRRVRRWLQHRILGEYHPVSTTP